MELQPKFYRLEQKISDLRQFSEVGVTDAKECGLSSLNELFLLKKGYPLFIGGNPFSGKSEFALEIMVNTSIMYGWKHFVYCGEGGNVENIFAEIFHKVAGKSYKYCEEKEKVSHEYFVNEHFVIANHDLDFTVDEFYETVDNAERELNIKFDTTLFDPFNDIVDESSKYNGREDKFLADALKKVRISSKKNNRIDMIINHIADVRRVKDDSSGNFYTPPALPNEWAGGRTWWRRAFTMILIYRYPTFINKENGTPYEENETVVFVQKAKPKGVGKVGRASIFWDWKRNRYYSFDEVGNKLYSCEKPQTQLTPNTNFFEDDTPF